MRKIKFRAKTIKDGRWVYGYYFQSPLTDEDSGVPIGMGWHFLSDGITRHCINQDGVVFIIDPNTLGQFTGQFTGELDEKRKEIYEGDIVEIWQECFETEDEDGTEHPDAESKHISKVEYRSGGFVIEDDFGDYQTTTVGWATDYGENQLYVLGNIIDNPELLK